MNRPEDIAGDRTCVLHLGAPKCGSSSLQMALSATPNIRSGSGRDYRYIARLPHRFRLLPMGRTIGGRAVRTAARLSKVGYCAWTDPLRFPDDGYWSDMRRVIEDGRRKDFIPVLSQEAWVHRPRLFAEHLFSAPHVRGLAIVFVRPPLEFLNATYWQWGVWSGLDFRTWLQKRRRYRIGTCMRAWSRIPRVSLRVLSAKEDVVQAFSSVLGVPLPPGARGNPSCPPALMGFLLRNRRFRPAAHHVGVEFCFGRWCRPPGPERLWAPRPDDLKLVRSDLEAEVDRLLGAVPPADAEALRADPSWTDVDSGLERTRVGPLDDSRSLAMLHEALRRGLEACCAAADLETPRLRPRPATAAGTAAWDEAIADALQSLIDADRIFRIQSVLGPRTPRWIVTRMARRIG